MRGGGAMAGDAPDAVDREQSLPGCDRTVDAVDVVRDVGGQLLGAKAAACRPALDLAALDLANEPVRARASRAG